MPHSVLLPSSKRKPPLGAISWKADPECIRGSLGAHIWDKVQGKAGPQAYSSMWLPSLACFPLCPYTFVWNIFSSPSLLPTPTKLSLCQTQRPSRGCFSRGQSEKPLWGDPCLHRAGTSLHLMPLKTTKWVSWYKFSYLRWLQVFLEQATKCLLAFMLSIISPSLGFWADQENTPCYDLGSFPFCWRGINAGCSASFR